MGVVSCGLLGPLALRVDTEQVELAAAKQRTVLALLVARRNTAVRIDRILEELWPDELPGSAIANVRTYVSALRRALGAERDRLVTGAESYTLRLADNDVDVAAFDRATKQAREARTLGEALDHYRYALTLWRGEALQDVTAGPSLRPYATALTESWLSATEQYRQTQFLTGDTAAAVDGLWRLVTEHPARESAWAALVRMLYAAGDRTGALAAYREARHSLVTALGLDPGPELAAAHRDVLAGVRPTGPPPVVPRQLPPAPAVLVGRDTELARLRAALAGDGLVAIHGLGGTGKSALAVVAAHHLAGAYPDGQLYVDLQGATPGVRPRAPGEVLTRFLRALGVAENRIGPDVDENAATFRTVTADRRVLLLLDNAVDLAQLRPMLPAGRGCGVLVTSRRPLSTLDGATQLPLGELSEQAAVELLGRLAGATRLTRHPDAALDLARLCGRLPLALRIIGVRLTRSPQWTLRDAASHLRSARSRLDELDLADLDVRSTFEVGYRALVEEGGAGARLFRLLGVVGFAEFTSTEAAALVDMPERAVRRPLEALVDHGLVEQNGADYRVHDLLRLLAVELADRHESPEAIAAAVRRVADTYLCILLSSKVLRQAQDDDQEAPSAPSDVPTPTTPAEAEEWYVRHLPPLVTLVTRLVAAPDTVDLAYDLVRPLHRSLAFRQPAEGLRLFLPVLASAEAADRPDLAAPTLCTLANCYDAMYRFTAAVDCADRARLLLPRIADDRLRARVFGVSAQAHRQVGNPALAAELAAEAVELFSRHERWMAVGICLGIAGSVACELERYEASRRLHRRSLWLNRRHGVPVDRAFALENLAVLYLRMGRPGAAARCGTAALRIAEEVGSAHLLDISLQVRALARQAQGRAADAIADAERAVNSVGDLGSDHAVIATLRTLGVVLWLSGDPRATEVLARADRLATNSRDPRRITQ